MPRRSTKFYRRNEEEVMRELGLNPTVNSGAGWVEKEDGQNDHLIAQLKSTDAASISIRLRDIEVLEANAQISHKVPVFVIQFLGTGDVFIMARPADMKEVVTYMDTGDCQRPSDEFALQPNIEHHGGVKPTIRSNASSRESFWESKRKDGESWKRKSRQK